MDAQSQAMAELNRTYRFELPAAEEHLALEEERLLAYLAVREATRPAAQALETRSQRFKAEHGGDKEASLSAAFKAGGELADLVMSVRSSFIEALRAQRMSPREFHALTVTLQASAYRKELRMAGIPMELQHEEGTPAEDAGWARREAIAAANDALLEKYGESIERAGAHDLEFLVVDGIE
jgi:hypothetical protein